ncbi:ribonuclease H-like domain-containing protein [Xylariomycetidae sp. FL2044]|nr:ribonuclease H-like domain-containing protein [Xylariomycetidae sp. FL2044]
MLTSTLAISSHHISTRHRQLLLHHFGEKIHYSVSTFSSHFLRTLNTWITTMSLEFEVDGGCRGNGSPHSVGVAAAVLRLPGGNHSARTVDVDNREYWPTNQRAELTAAILALKWALEEFESRGWSRMDVVIKSDSRYVVGCMTEWYFTWRQNGWVNFHGAPVVNRDLIEEAAYLSGEVQGRGSLCYNWIPRRQNALADGYCDGALRRRSGY